MNYKAFYRTYRPNTFDKVVGQDHIVRTLLNIIKMNKISHGYLFCGPRGTGKTSIARVFANTINCTHTKEAEAICNHCLENANKSLDIIEIDAASNNGVNDIRTIREQINFAPTNHPYKIYIIDEIHMLSKGAFNALLMTLEEPPKHAIFILATTNPDKIPDTVLSRVQRYNFKRITKNVLKSQLEYIFKTEDIKFDQDSLELIATLANGSLRDALSIADQINAYANSNITKNDLMDIFGLVSIESQVELINYLVNKNVGQALQYFDALVSAGVDLSKLVVSLINLLKDFLIYKKTANTNLIETCSEEQVNQIQIKSDYVYKFLEILTPLSNQIKYSEIPQQLFQLAIIQLCSIDAPLKDFPSEKTTTFVNDDFANYLSPKNFDDSDKVKDITSERFIQTNAQDFGSTNRLNVSNQTKDQTILSEFSTNEVKKRFDNFFDDQSLLVEKAKTETEINPFETKDSTEEFPFKSSQSETKSIEEKFDLQINNNATETEAFSFENTYGDADDVLERATNLINMANEADGSEVEVDETILLESSKEFNNQIDKQIYDTNEIDLTKPKDFSNIINPEATEEFDISKTEPKTILTNTNSNEYKLTQPNIINLFILADRDSFDHFKQALTRAILNMNGEFGRFTALLKDVKFICSANNFILVSSKENWIINDLKSFETDLKFQEFLSQSFGKKTHFFAITKDEYQEAKKLYLELKTANNVPKVIALPDKVIINQNDDQDKHKETEMKAKALFGSLFKKRSH